MHQQPLSQPVPPMNQQYYSPPPFWNQQCYLPIHPYQGYTNQAIPHLNQHQQTNSSQDSQPPQKKQRIFYYLTHGACFHPGFKCRNKAMGHQDSATFQNRMGGGVKNVKGIQPH